MFLGLIQSQIIHAQTAKALWCAGNTTFYLTYDSNTYNAGDSYDGQTITNVYSIDDDSRYQSTTVPWKAIQKSVTSVVVNSNFTNFNPKYLDYWFANFTKATFIGLNYINTSEATSLWDTFSSCRGLTSLDELRSWDVSKVEILTKIFTSCSNLTSLEPISNWNTENVKSMWYSFSKCSKLTSLEPIRNWKTSNVTDFSYTFEYTGITSLEPISNWNTDNLTKMNYIFSTTPITSLEPIRNWNTSKVTEMQGIFMNCSELTSLEPISGWNTENVQTIRQIFYGTPITSLEPIRNWKTSKVTSIAGFIQGCSNLTSLEPIRNWSTESLTNMSDAFASCSNITSLEPISNWNTSKVTNMRSLFHSNYGVTSLEPIKNWNTSKVTNMYACFHGCTNLTLVDLSGWDTGNVTDMKELFKDCKALRGITFGENFKMNKVSDANAIDMFSGCNKLRYIDFYNSNYATSGSGLKFPLNTADRTEGVFNGVPETTVIFLPKKNGVVTNVTNVVYSYNGDASDLRCPKYYSIDKVDIEFPHSFKTNEAVYLRDMTGKQYGSVILPYDFTSNSDIQAYSLSKQNMNPLVLTFTDVQTVPAHTPFAFKRLNSNPQSTEFLMKDNSGNFGIIVNATRSTNAAEKTWTSAGPDATIGSPYIGSTGLSNWKTKGYYVKETVNDYNGMFFVQDNEFKRAIGPLNLVDHRVLFYPTDGSGAASVFSLSFEDEDDITTAIEAAETEQALSEAAAIYDASGCRLSEARKGLNIIRMSDGTVKKVFIK